MVKEKGLARQTRGCADSGCNAVTVGLIHSYGATGSTQTSLKGIFQGYHSLWQGVYEAWVSQISKGSKGKQRIFIIFCHFCPTESQQPLPLW